MEKTRLWTDLDEMFRRVETVPDAHDRRFVVFGDLHMGAGGHNDDFRDNAELFLSVLDSYYRPRGFTLILNGDIEELQRFSLNGIRRKWERAFRLFRAFAAGGRLYKIIGNHDLKLLRRLRGRSDFALHHGLRLNFGENDIFVFHGHQVWDYFKYFLWFDELSLRLWANPLGIKNYVPPLESRRVFKIEKRIYDYSKARRILSVIGHTHRPAFASAAAPAAPGLPCLFNAGCVIGNNGITGIEIGDGDIALVHYRNRGGRKRPAPAGGGFERRVVARESLDRIFSALRPDPSGAN